jgi:hypothetical protein
LNNSLGSTIAYWHFGENFNGKGGPMNQNRVFKKWLWLTMAYLSFSSVAFGQVSSNSYDSLPVSGSFPSWISSESIRNATRSMPENGPYRHNAPQAHGPGTGVAQGYTITVDTRDSFACRKVYNEVKGLQNPSGQQITIEEACAYNANQPMATFVVVRDIDREEFRTSVDTSKILSTDKNIINDTRNLALTMVGAMGVLWVMPESSTGWDKSDIRKNEGGLYNRWKEKVSAGPVMDDDAARFNLIGHPIAGAAYYVMARHAGLTGMQAFGYSVAMSTFFWEYGFEAIAEIPSIQDLIITPVIGSILGEVFYRLEAHINSNGGTVLGSRRLGKVALVVLNPMGKLSETINVAIGSKFIQSSTTEIIVRRKRNPQFPDQESQYIGIQTVFRF